MKSFAFFVPLLAAASAAAHGLVTQITIDGKAYQGGLPNGARIDSVIRQINDPSPIKGARNPNTNCGPGAKPAKLNANANPGSQVTFKWQGADRSNWPHNIGPMMTYMASCGEQTCDKFDSTKAKWFKIGEEGKKADGTWLQNDLKNGGVAHATIPSNLAAGNYLIKHEIIALHLATSLGGAEFYEGCAQLKVGGNKNGHPAPNDLVSLPGAYSDNDKGIFDKNVFDNNDKYVFPGPPIATFVNGGGSTLNGNEGGDNTPPTPTKSGDDGQVTPTPTTTGKPKMSGTCKPKNKKNAASPSVGAAAISSSGSMATGAPEAAGSYYPRRVSRVMRLHQAQGLQHSH
jgi:hypothetical protein